MATLGDENAVGVPHLSVFFEKAVLQEASPERTANRSGRGTSSYVHRELDGRHPRCRDIEVEHSGWKCVAGKEQSCRIDVTIIGKREPAAHQPSSRALTVAKSDVIGMTAGSKPTVQMREVTDRCAPQKRTIVEVRHLRHFTGHRCNTTLTRQISHRCEHLDDVRAPTVDLTPHRGRCGGESSSDSNGSDFDDHRSSGARRQVVTGHRQAIRSLQHVPDGPTDNGQDVPAVGIPRNVPPVMDLGVESHLLCDAGTRHIGFADGTSSAHDGSCPVEFVRGRVRCHKDWLANGRAPARIRSASARFQVVA